MMWPSECGVWCGLQGVKCDVVLSVECDVVFKLWSVVVTSGFGCDVVFRVWSVIVTSDCGV